MAHQAAFNAVCVIVDKTLIAKQGVVKMTDLVQRYADQRQESPFHNLQLIKVREPQSQVNEDVP